ncbi:hypothetical protein FRX31_015656, partial [Thalictrum thalictroides]
MAHRTIPLVCHGGTTRLRSPRSRRISFVHVIQMVRNIENVALSANNARRSNPLMPSGRTSRLRSRRSRRISFERFAKLIKSFEEVGLSSYVSTRRRSTRSRRTNFFSLLPIDEQRKHSFLHEVEVYEHVQNLTETMIQSACRKTLMVAFSRENMVASTSYTGSISNEPHRRLLLNQPLAPSMKKVSETLSRNARRKKYRAMLPSEQKHAIMELDSARRRLARSKRSSEQREVERSHDAVRRRNSRTGDASTIAPRNLENYFGSTILTNAQKFRKSCQEIKWVSCPECRRNFPDVKLSSGICTTCSLEKQRAKNPHMFSAANCMDPGIVPIELSRLSNLEQILVARIHPVMSVYRVKGQQYKYSGNVINFEQDVNLIATILPIKPADLSAILIVQRNGKHANKEFRVRREFVRQALIWLKKNHVYYRDVEIDIGCLSQLPIDGKPEDIPHATDDNAFAYDEEEIEGPPEIVEQDVQIDEFQFVGTIAVAPQPNQQTCIERVLQVQDADSTVAQMPFTTNVIDEFSTPGYISMAFPALFPYGNADLRQARPRKINHSEYFQYLMKFHDGRFAKDSRFRYFAWNSLSRWRALALGDVYVKRNPQDGELSIQDIQNMLLSGDRQIAKRLSYYGKSIRGTRAYWWYTRLKELTAMVKQL